MKSKTISKIFCGEKLNAALDMTVKGGIKIDGIVFSTKNELYEHIEEKLGVDKETIKKWASHKSNGPREQFYVDALEKMFNIPLLITADEAMQYTRYPDITKSSVSELIGDLTVLVYDGLLFMENDNQYWNWVEKMHRFKPVIPFPLYDELEEFQQKLLFPYVCKNIETVPEAYSEMCGYWNEEEHFVITNGKLHLSILSEKIKEIEVELEKIIENKVHPIIFNM